MKIASILKLQTRLLRRRNKAQRLFKARPYDPLDHTRTRLDAQVGALDDVLDDISRLIANNHDRFHDRRKK